MTRNLLNLFPAGFLKAGLTTAFSLAICLSSFGQTTRFVKQENPVSGSPNFAEVLKTYPKGKPVLSHARQAGPSYPLTSMLYYPNGSGGWTLNANTKYTYDALGNQTSFTKYPVVPQMIPDKDSSLYDAQGNQIFLGNFDYHAPSNSWIMGWGDQYLYTYNATGKPTEMIYQTWDNGAWKNSARDIMTYNSAGQPDEQTSHEWDNNAWRPTNKTTFNYAVATNPPTGFLVLKNQNGAWVNEVRFQNVTWRNFNNFELANYEAQFWMNGLWVNAQKITVTNTANGGWVSVNQIWPGLSWQNSERETMTYDSQQNFTSRKNELWQNNAWAFDYEYTDLLTYNAANQITERISRAWDPSSNSMQDYQREVYTTFQVMGTRKNAPQLSVNVYPNPARNFIWVRVENQEAIHVSVTDLTGKLILTKTLPAEIQNQLNLSSLAPGAYLLKLETSKGNSLQKIMKH